MSYLAVQAVRTASTAEWDWLPLKRLARLRRHRNVGREAPLLSVSAERGVERRPPEGGRQLPSDDTIADYWIVKPGDLVFNPMWAIGGGVASSALHGAVSPAYRVYKPTDRLVPRFLHYWLRSSAAIRQYELLTRGDTTFDRSVTREDFEGMPVPVPPVEEQRQIVDLLDAETARIEALIEKKRRMVDLLEVRWARTVRARLGELAPVMPLKRRWRVIDCKHRTPSYVDDGYPVVSPGDISPGRIYLSRCERFVNETDFIDLTEGRRPKRGDIIYSRNASAGIAAHVDTDDAFCMGQDVCLITSNYQDQRFLAYALNSVGADQLEPLKIGSTITRINVDQIGELRVPVPTPEVQKDIADALDAARALIDCTRETLGRQLELLREHRAALISAAVTGFDVAKAAA